MSTKLLSFIEKTCFFSKKRIQIENSGFVKTCDEYVRRPIQPEGVPKLMQYLYIKQAYQKMTLENLDPISPQELQMK